MISYCQTQLLEEMIFFLEGGTRYSKLSTSVRDNDIGLTLQSTDKSLKFVQNLSEVMGLLYGKTYKDLSVIALHQAQPLDEFDFSSKMQSLSLAMEQTQDKNNYTVIGWIKRNIFRPRQHIYFLN